MHPSQLLHIDSTMILPFRSSRWSNYIYPSIWYQFPINILNYYSFVNCCKHLRWASSSIIVIVACERSVASAGSFHMYTFWLREKCYLLNDCLTFWKNQPTKIPVNAIINANIMYNIILPWSSGMTNHALIQFLELIHHGMEDNIVLPHECVLSLTSRAHL